MHFRCVCLDVFVFMWDVCDKGCVCGCIQGVCGCVLSSFGVVVVVAVDASGDTSGCGALRGARALIEPHARHRNPAPSYVFETVMQKQNTQ